MRPPRGCPPHCGAADGRQPRGGGATHSAGAAAAIDAASSNGTMVRGATCGGRDRGGADMGGSLAAVGAGTGVVATAGAGAAAASTQSERRPRGRHWHWPPPWPRADGRPAADTVDDSVEARAGGGAPLAVGWGQIGGRGKPHAAHPRAGRGEAARAVWTIAGAAARNASAARLEAAALAAAVVSLVGERMTTRRAIGAAPPCGCCGVGTSPFDRLPATASVRVRGVGGGGGGGGGGGCGGAAAAAVGGPRRPVWVARARLGTDWSVECCVRERWRPLADGRVGGRVGRHSWSPVFGTGPWAAAETGAGETSARLSERRRPNQRGSLAAAATPVGLTIVWRLRRGRAPHKSATAAADGNGGGGQGTLPGRDAPGLHIEERRRRSPPRSTAAARLAAAARAVTPASRWRSGWRRRWAVVASPWSPRQWSRVLPRREDYAVETRGAIPTDGGGGGGSRTLRRRRRGCTQRGRRWRHVAVAAPPSLSPCPLRG